MSNIAIPYGNVVFNTTTTPTPGITYYISNISGSNSNSGTSSLSPWPYSKITGTTFMSGSSILFNRNESFTGSINITYSGTSDHPISWGSYGSGSNPIITGFKTVTGWTNSGSGVWTYTDSSLGNLVNVLTINGNIQPYGRYPHNNYATFSAFDGTGSITDLSLNNTPSYVGGEVVIRTNNFTLQRSVITSQNNGVIGYTTPFGASTPANIGLGYFIQNHPNCLTNFGDWCYDSGSYTIKMYFSSSNPSEYTVNVSQVDSLMVFSGSYSNHNINNIDFIGANSYGIYEINNKVISNILINSCSFSNIGVYPIAFQNPSNVNITNNKITENPNGGIFLSSANGNNNISNNYISSSGHIPGLGVGLNPINYLNYYAAYCALVVEYQTNAFFNTASYNTIINTGYNGIGFGGYNYIIKNNYIHDYCTVLNDGGGIYTNNYGNTTPYTSSRYILDNIILNGGNGSAQGTTNQNIGSTGIYCDDDSNNIIITGNTSANNSLHGIYHHGNRNITTSENTFYNNSYSQICVGWDNSTIDLSPTDFTITNNIAIINSSSQYCVYHYSETPSSSFNDFSTSSFGIYSDNTYGSTVPNLTGSFNTLLWNTNNPYPGNVVRTLSGWQTYANQDSGSTYTIPTSVSHSLYVNPSTSSITIPIVGINTDIKGNIYSGSLILEPYKSVILFES